MAEQGALPYLLWRTRTLSSVTADPSPQLTPHRIGDLDGGATSFSSDEDPNPDFGALVFLIGDRASYARDGASVFERKA
jgi:hypothetical protein